MGEFVNPALCRFLESFGEQTTVAQVLVVRRAEQVFELRHVMDAEVGSMELKLLPAGELRSWTQETDDGRFRPLRASPDLRRGWRCEAHGLAELEVALEGLYPGFLADWFVVQKGHPPVTDYETFTRRQTGMYRLTAKASPEQARQIVESCCAARFCLKRRLWTAPDLPADPVESKSIIPCLEPCAVLLEFARKRMRISQECAVQLDLAPTEIRGLLTALERTLAHTEPQMRVADFNAPANPRHLEYVRRKLTAALPQSSVAPAVEEA